MSCVFLKLTVPWKKLPDGLSDVTNKSFHEPLLKSHYRGVASFFLWGVKVGEPAPADHDAQHFPKKLAAGEIYSIFTVFGLVLHRKVGLDSKII